ncbi:hypothetical protein [Paracoccus chinensis]|nr:hypothetical protein [Paracoccus chinensis]
MFGMDEDRLVQFKLMLPASLKADLEAGAAEARRSLSQHIVGILLGVQKLANEAEKFGDPVAFIENAVAHGEKDEIRLMREETIKMSEAVSAAFESLKRREDRVQEIEEQLIERLKAIETMNVRFTKPQE